ncbi:LAFA_0D03048g1_1 [Lachancea sp. 'fantastica']|nr:LAFA_0D03048g1_1 [Lachancea sp. 'fantastica']
MVVSSSGLQHEIEFCIQEMERLKVTELKSVSRSIGLPLGGRKADLQDRLRSYLNGSCRGNSIDPWRPKTILLLMDKVRQNDALPTYESLWLGLKTGSLQHNPVATGHQPPSSLGTSSHGTHTKVEQQVPKTRFALQFGQSPFYRLKRMLNGSPKFAPKNGGRGVCSYYFTFNREEAAIMGCEGWGTQFKLYLFCGVLPPVVDTSVPSPIQFPHPNDITFNGITVKDNVRGLKNKPGTAKPADLTPYVRASSENHLQLTYAFTKEDYLVCCYIVEVFPPQEILKEVLRHPKIVKPATLQYLRESLSEDEDEDLVTTSTIMTLQCPISYCRMRYPSKSVHCRHLQCFDALWYIESQQQIPTWHCPVCQKTVKVEDLVLCEFVESIIAECDDEVEQVEISKDGSWKPIFEDETPAPREQSKVHVKSENGRGLGSDDNNMSDEDGNEPIPAGRARTQQTDPVVISLDSEDEDEGPVRNGPAQNSGTDSLSTSSTVAPQATAEGQSDHQMPRDNTLGNIYSTYMDSTSEPLPTLDPRRTNSTPLGSNHASSTALSPGETNEPDSAVFFHRQRSVPNVLGRTPLRNASHGDGDSEYQNSVESRANNSLSPSPTNNTSLLPGLTNPELSVPARNEHASEASDSGEAPANGNRNHQGIVSSSGYQPAAAHNYPSLFEKSTSEGGNLLGLGNGTGVTAPQQQKNSENYNVPPSNNENSQNDNNLPNNPGRQEYHTSQPQTRGSLFTRPDSGLYQNSHADTGHDSNSQRSTARPPLPPLPPVPQSINRNLNTTKPTDSSSMRHRKPIVSPFIPKRSYANMLPQKRQISTDSANKSTTSVGHNSTSNLSTSRADSASGSVSPPPPILHRSDDNELDFIDLTSDE